MLLPDLRGGGAERVWLNLGKVFSKKGYLVEFVVMRKTGELIEELPARVRLVDLNAFRIRDSIFPLKRYFREAKPDVTLIAMWPLTIIAIIAGILSGSKTKVFVSDHEHLSLSNAIKQTFVNRLLLRFTIGIFYPLAQARIGVSNGVAKDIEKLGRLKENSVRVIYNPIVKDEEDIEKDFINPWDKSTAKKILTVGNLKIEKNHELLIRAFAKVKKTINAVLVILGEGELRKKMEDLIHELNLSDSVKLPGYVPNPYPWYKNADLFVLSSNHEGFGNVIVEALSCGIPVVSTNCPSGPGEILESGKYGILVPVNDSNAMAAAIIKSLNMEHDKVKLENRANDFSTENIGEKYLELMFG